MRETKALSEYEPGHLYTIVVGERSGAQRVRHHNNTPLGVSGFRHLPLNWMVI